MKVRDFLPNFITKHWDQFFKKIESSLVFFTPAYVSKHNSLFSPLIALVALIVSIVLIGVAVGSFFTFFTSLLVLYFILTRVFGIRMDLGDVFVVQK